MDEKKTVLIVEDEKSIVDILQYNLKKEYNILTANDGEAGLDMALRENPDILLLDLMLPKMDGFEVCRILREKGNKVPVIILTAREGEDDKVKGLELGADDYITKPFSLAVLRARVATQLRRMETGACDGEWITDGDYRFHFAKMLFYHGAEQIELSKAEQKLLRFLVENRGITLSRDKLLDSVWSVDAAFVDENTLSVTVKRLRDKLGAQDKIKTVYGIGYRWE